MRNFEEFFTSFANVIELSKNTACYHELSSYVLVKKVGWMYGWHDVGSTNITSSVVVVVRKRIETMILKAVV